MALQTLPLWVPLAADGVTQILHPAELQRSILKSIATRSGVVHPPSGITAVGTNTGGDFAGTVVPAAMQLTVAAGAAFIVGRESTLQGAGAYYAYSEASEVVSWPASSGSNRMDSLILQVDDPQYGSIGGNPLGAWWRAVAGSSASARPDSDFTLGGSQYIPGAWLRVYDVLVGASVTQLTQANVAFKGGYSNLLGYTPMYSTAQPATGYFGERGYIIDGGQWVTWNGVNWALTGVNTVTSAVSTGGTTTSTTYTATLSGSTVCGVAFVAPGSGSVRIDFCATQSAGTAVFTLSTFEVRTGAVVGSGTVAFAPTADDETLQNTTASAATSARHTIVTGLTPGSSYNVQMLHRVASGTGTFLRRRVTVTGA